MIHYTICASPIGQMLLAQTEKGVAAVYFHESKDDLLATLKKQFPNETLSEDSAVCQLFAEQVNSLIQHPHLKTMLPLDARGTAFQKKVWEVLINIPVGQTLTYGQVALALAQPKAVRAVARACGANPISILIPCHRVIGKNGKLTGYHWGIEKKQALLDKEMNLQKESA